MVIRSPFKDYYDFVANQYGGGDPRTLYVRDRLAAPRQHFETYRTVEVSEFPLPSPEELCRSHGWIKLELSSLFLVIAGKLYLIARPAKSLEPANPNNYRLQPLSPPEPPKKDTWRWNYLRRHWPDFGTEFPCLVELSRMLQAPVFAIADVTTPWRSSKTRIKICGQCPILGTIGMPALIDPFQMYQDLAYFVGNTMKRAPDTEPPVEVSNREKILKAGFDLKQSFRHRA